MSPLEREPELEQGEAQRDGRKARGPGDRDPEGRPTLTIQAPLMERSF